MIPTSAPSPSPEGSGAGGWQTLLQAPRSARAGIRFHLVGIGGAGLSAIARLLLGRGFTVSGSDARPSATTTALQALGATIFIGHAAGQVRGADLLLVSSAIPTDNAELVAARQAGIAVVKRHQFLAPLMAGYRAICVAGTHGKTTTSAIIATLLDGAGAEPSFIVGSQILNLGTSARDGRPGGPFVIEADEYDRTFLGLRPQIAVITNVEWDHVDCYPKAADFEAAFREFVALVPADGAVIACGDDPGVQRLRRAVPRADAGGPRWISYGFGRDNDWQAGAVVPNDLGGVDFEVRRGDHPLARASLRLAGRHNALNALAALAACDAAGYVFTEPYKNLKILREVAGTARRLELKGESCGIIVLDDYAHHPSEVRATLSAVRQRFPRRPVWVLFQPHTYSRTGALLDEFCRSFENADHVLITDIYAAREHDTMGVSALDLVTGLANHPDTRYAGDPESAAALLLQEMRHGDVLVTMGAGDGDRAGALVLESLRRRETEQPTSAADPRPALADDITAATGLPVAFDELLAAHTTMRIGGPADLFVAVDSVDQMVAVVELARRQQVPTLILGGGSNVLVSDRGVRGLVIVNRCRSVRRHEGDVVWAEAGANLAGLARQTLRWGLGGLEWGVSVPGTLGGAVVGNAGAHGGAVADNLLRATLLMPDGALAEWPAPRFGFAYRHSVLKEIIRAGQDAPLVLAAAFQLAPADPDALEERAAQNLAHRRATQPVEASAGSIFQNPPGDFAGRVLDSLGFKGRRHGQAAFSTLHANFIVNHGGARAADVVALIEEARQAARQALDIELVPEILFVGEWQ